MTAGSIPRGGEYASDGYATAPPVSPRATADLLISEGKLPPIPTRIMEEKIRLTNSRVECLKQIGMQAFKPRETDETRECFREKSATLAARWGEIKPLYIARGFTTGLRAVEAFENAIKVWPPLSTAWMNAATIAKPLGTWAVWKKEAPGFIKGSTEEELSWATAWEKYTEIALLIATIAQSWPPPHREISSVLEKWTEASSKQGVWTETAVLYSVAFWQEIKDAYDGKELALLQQELARIDAAIRTNSQTLFGWRDTYPPLFGSLLTFAVRFRYRRADYLSALFDYHAQALPLLGDIHDKHIQYVHDTILASVLDIDVRWNGVETLLTLCKAVPAEFLSPAIQNAFALEQDMVDFYVFFEVAKSDALVLEALKHVAAVKGASLMLTAALIGSADAVRILIEAGVHKETMDDYGYTALMLAAENGQAQVIQTLIAMGANTEIKDSRGKTVLMLAVENGYVQAAQTLIDMGVDKNARDSEGKTALMLAATIGNIDIVRILITAGVDRSTYDHKHRTVLELAIQDHTDAIIGSMWSKKTIRGKLFHDKSREKMVLALCGREHVDLDVLERSSTECGLGSCLELFASVSIEELPEVIDQMIKI